MRPLFLLAVISVFLYACTDKEELRSAAIHKEQGMTVQSANSFADFKGNGVTQIFPIAFRFANANDLKVIITDAEGTSRTLTLNSDYTVSGGGDEASGSVTILSAPSGEEDVKVIRETELSQETDLRNQGAFYAETHEDAFDKLTMIAQENASGIRSAIRVAESDPEPKRLPPVAVRAGKVLGFDSEGNPVGTLPGSGTATELALDLAGPGGSALVGRGESTVNEDLAKLEAHVAVEPTPLDAPYNAKGDGVTSDTAAFAAFEAAVEGRVVDLGGKSYVVASVPKSNAYVNGQFVVGGFNRPALPFNTFMSPAPKYHAFGGQLRKLKEQLANPLNQYVGIAFIGDSITWGSGASGTGGSPDRDGTLSDPRATYGAPSFVNQVKRYIRDNYKSGDGLAEVVSNWPGSSTGESTVLYQNRELLYPRYGQFTVAKIDASQDPADLSTNNSPSGMILSLNNTVEGAQYGHSIVFTFTGSKFALGIRTSTGGATDAYYDVLINGALHATVNARPGFNGLVDDNTNYDQRITTEFPYVKDATITIRTNRNGLTGQRLLSVTGLHIDRQVRIVNNGIIGATTVSYLEKNMAGNTSGDGTAVVGADQFVFCQLGTNDRAWTTGRPRGSNQFYVNLKALLANASLTGKEVILMAANPAANEDPTVYPFHMQEVRNIIYRTAKELSLDMIDNYTIFQGLNNSVYTDDGLHPNDFGHSLIARNIINSLESE